MSNSSDCRGFYLMATDGEKYVTHLDLMISQKELKEDVNSKIDEVDGKVDYLNNIVLPLVESSKQTAKNTEKIAISMDKFTEEQRKTNSNIYERINEQDVSLAELGKVTSSHADKRKSNVTIVVAVIGAMATIITGIFGLAPYIFG